MKSDGGPAFPGVEFYKDPDKFAKSEYRNVGTGMSLRDWFAGMALGGGTIGIPAETVALWTYEIADAMLKERENET